MAIIVPQDWSEARLDTATPTDPAPLLAIDYAIKERAALLAGTPPGDSGMHIAPYPGLISEFPDYPYGTGSFVYHGIASAIRSLQSKYLNISYPYNSTSFYEWPKTLTCNRSKSYGIDPNDALARLPMAPEPFPGDSTVSAVTRAFFAWARSALDEMTCLDASAIYRGSNHVASIDYAAIYTNGGASTISELVSGATRGGSSSHVWHGFSGYYNRSGEFLGYRYLSVPVGITITNRTHLQAKAMLVLKALGYPCDGAWKETDYTANPTFTSFGAPGIGSTPGISSVEVQLGANGGVATFWADSGSCPTPTFSRPSVPGSNIPYSSSGYRIFNVGFNEGAILDFSQSFRFKPDPSGSSGT